MIPLFELGATRALWTDFVDWIKYVYYNNNVPGVPMDAVVMYALCRTLLPKKSLVQRLRSGLHCLIQSCFKRFKQFKTGLNSKISIKRNSTHYSYRAWPTGSVYMVLCSTWFVWYIPGTGVHFKEGTNRAKSVWCVQRACSWTFPNDSDVCLWVCIRFEPFVFIGKQTSGIVRFGHEIKVNVRRYTLNEPPFIAINYIITC